MESRSPDYLQGSLIFQAPPWDIGEIQQCWDSVASLAHGLGTIMKMPTNYPNQYDS